MLRVCLDDEEVLQWLYLAAQDFARRCTNRSITRVHVGNHDGVRTMEGCEESPQERVFAASPKR